MKTVLPILCVFAMAASAVQAADGGAPAPAAPPAPPVVGHPPAGSAGEGRFGRRDGELPLERFMEWYRQRQPEEFARLQKLREEDPDAFRAEMRQKLEKARDRFGDGRGTGPGRRGPGGEGRRDPSDNPPGGEGRGWAPGGPDGRHLRRLADGHPEAAVLLASLREKLDAYRVAADDEARDSLKRELRGLVAKLYEIRIADQEKQLEQLDADLLRLKDEIARRRADFETLVNQRVEELLAEPAAPAGGPEPPAPPPTL